MVILVLVLAVQKASCIGALPSDPITKVVFGADEANQELRNSKHMPRDACPEGLVPILVPIPLARSTRVIAAKRDKLTMIRVGYHFTREWR